MTQDNTLQTIEALIEQFEISNVGEGTTFEGSDHRLIPNGYFEEWANTIKSLYESAQEMAEALKRCAAHTSRTEKVLKEKCKQALSNFNAMKEKQK